MPKAPVQSQRWWRDYYKDHPQKNDRNSDAYAPNKKLKVYCKACWHSHVAQIKMDVNAADSAGEFSMLPREDDAISTYCKLKFF